MLPSCIICGATTGQRRNKYCSRRCYGAARIAAAPALFWTYIKRCGPDDCWPWTAHRDPHGYGSFTFGGRRRPASRVAWMLSNDEPIGDRFVLHTCDNPQCCNPAHLYPGTHADNMRDMADKGRTAKQRQTVCGRGHPFDDANTAIFLSPNGRPGRRCRPCDNIRHREWRARKTASASHPSTHREQSA